MASIIGSRLLVILPVFFFFFFLLLLYINIEFKTVKCIDIGVYNSIISMYDNYRIKINICQRPLTPEHASLRVPDEGDPSPAYPATPQ